jgi:hypothetical protein
VGGRTGAFLADSLHCLQFFMENVVTCAYLFSYSIIQVTKFYS